jgi:hypothetical protein
VGDSGTWPLERRVCDIPTVERPALKERRETIAPTKPDDPRMQLVEYLDRYFGGMAGSEPDTEHTEGFHDAMRELLYECARWWANVPYDSGNAEDKLLKLTIAIRDAK